jgi:hypothetical protein
VRSAKSTFSARNQFVTLPFTSGVVTIDDRLEGDVMCVRKSMDKFTSSHTNIEVCSWSRPIPAHLNKQVIIILSALGVPDDVFIDAQNDALSRVSAALESMKGSQKVRFSFLHLLLCASTLRNTPVTGH